MAVIRFSDLNRCPFCGCETYYQKYTYSGSGWFFSNFDGSEADNTNMYDGVSSFGGKRTYCAECNRYLGDVERDTLGKRASDAYEEGLRDVYYKPQMS